MRPLIRLISRYLNICYNKQYVRVTSGFDKLSLETQCIGVHLNIEQ